MKPTFIVKVLTAIMTVILLVYIFIITSLYADQLWKAEIGLSHVILCAVMAFTMILVTLSFLFYFYKIFFERSLAFFFLSVALAVGYICEDIVFCAGYTSHNQYEKYSKRILNHVSNVTDSATEWFVQKYEVKTIGLATAVQDYCSERTTKVATGITFSSMIWLVLYAILLFIVLFESIPEQDVASDLRPGIEV